jgi:cbb3-type cytochrome oxidase maturation protein
LSEAVFALTVMSLFIFFTFLGFFVWGLKTGQFRDIEEAKYRIFEFEPENMKEASEEGTE